MPRRIIRISVFLLVVLCALTGASLQTQASPQQSENEAKFFRQLRRIFGQFRHADLQQIFKGAQPVTCSDLVSDNGQWREVGFFNENRGFGNWFRTSMAEIRSQLDVYTFEGNCDRETSALHVTTKFPVDESLRAYRAGQTAFRDINVKTNAPVGAHFEKLTQAYTFDLPYLFRVSDIGEHPLYALSPRTASDQYAPEAINRWECKAVTAQDVTYRFLICRTTLLSRSISSTKSFGTSAFSILTDGQEASASVRLTFDEVSDVVPEQDPFIP